MKDENGYMTGEITGLLSVPCKGNFQAFFSQATVL